MENKATKEFGDFVTAIKNNNRDEVQRLFKIEYLNMNDEDGYTPFYVACMNGHTDTVCCLLDRGANIECENVYKSRPIHMAAIFGHTSVVTELISRNCLLTTINDHGRMAIDYAHASGNKECAQILYEAMKNSPGESILSIGDYTKVKSLGRGGFGEVYKYIDNRSQIHVAIKEVKLPPTLTSEEVKLQQSEEVKALQKEVDIFKMLPSHPNIVRYYSTMKDEYMMYIVMEYVDGESLRGKLDRVSTLDIDLIALYSYQILEGLNFLHQMNIIHRDIKASNILVDRKDYVKLCDFGISRYLRPLENTSESIDCSGREMAGTSIGTIYYMAPEVITEDSYTISADVWSMGATVVEMLIGDELFCYFLSILSLENLYED